ncbi:hypothetical protein Tco_0754351 [Tanacetum coccineum]
MVVTTDVKSASTPTDLEKPFVQDGDVVDVEEHLYRSMIGSLMYLTAFRPDIMFAVCAYARFQVSPKTSHLLAVKRIFRYLKGKPSLRLWYSKDSPWELVAYTDSDYAGATQDRKSTTGGCKFLGNRLISWQCKKQTVVATSTTEAEYVVAANCYGQITATIDGHSKTITEACLRRHLKLDDHDGITLERITKKRTKNKAKTTKPDSEWKSRKRQSQSPSPSVEKSTQVTRRTVTYRRRSEEKRIRKDKGKAIMTELEPNKKSNKEIEQESLSFAEAIRLQEQMDEEQEAQIARDEEIARQWDEEEGQRAMSEAKSSKKIDWNDPSVIRYHALKMKPKTIAQARRNMVKYLKNQGNYKISNFKGMSYNKIRLIFEKVWDFNQHIEPMDLEHGSERMKSPEKIEEEDVDTQKEMKEVSKESGAKRKKSLPRKSTRSTVKRQKMELDDEKEDLKGYLDIVPRENVAEDVESLSTKYPIVDWKTCVLTENFMYYQIFRGDGSSKNYKVLSEMLEDFDRQDVMDLHRLVKERYSASRPEGYDLMLWGDLHTLFEPDEEDEIWKNQHEYNVISWSLYDFCGIHILLMQNGIAIHMLTEKKYPLSQEMITKMLNKRLEVDHESTQAYELLKFIRSQVQK